VETQIFESYSLIARKKEKSGEEQIDDNDQKNGHDHGPSGGSADLLGPAARGQPFETPDSCNGDSEHHALR